MPYPVSVGYLSQENFTGAPVSRVFWCEDPGTGHCKAGEPVVLRVNAIR